MGIKAAFQQLAVCSTTWSSGISHGAQQLCTCTCLCEKSKITYRFSSDISYNVLSQFSMLLFVETGISLQLDYKFKKCTSEKVWKLLLDAKKKKKSGRPSLQFFLEGELSVVTAHAKISS